MRIETPRRSQLPTREERLEEYARVGALPPWDERPTPEEFEAACDDPARLGVLEAVMRNALKSRPRRAPIGGV